MNSCKQHASILSVVSRTLCARRLLYKLSLIYVLIDARVWHCWWLQAYPRIDTRQLDEQIKTIMKEIIPLLKEHMDDVCSQQLLLYIKRLVLSLTRQRSDDVTPQHEFVRFFHKQLSSILQDSLAKFEGRK